MHLCAEPPTPPSPFHLFRCLCPRGLLWSDPLSQVSLAMPTYSWHALLHVATLHDEVLFFQIIYPTRPVLDPSAGMNSWNRWSTSCTMVCAMTHTMVLPDASMNATKVQAHRENVVASHVLAHKVARNASECLDHHRHLHHLDLSEPFVCQCISCGSTSLLPHNCDPPCPANQSPATYQFLHCGISWLRRQLILLSGRQPT